jgi:hypothetical protein
MREQQLTFFATSPARVRIRIKATSTHQRYLPGVEFDAEPASSPNMWRIFSLADGLPLGLLHCMFAEEVHE